MAETKYLLRMGTSTQGPFALSEVRRRARSGALSKIALIKAVDGEWMIAGKFPGLFDAEGAETNDPRLHDDSSEEDRGALPDELSMPEDDGIFTLRIAGISGVPVQWVLVPAWVVIGVAALLPATQLPGTTLYAWNIQALAVAESWRGLLVGVAMLTFCVAALIGGAVSIWARGENRAELVRAIADCVLALAVAIFAAGSAGGMVTAGCIVVAALCVRMIDTIISEPPGRTVAHDVPLISSAATTRVVSVAVCAALVALVAGVFKGLSFSLSAFFALAAAALACIAAVNAGMDSPRRTIAMRCAIGALAATALAVLTEGITVTLLTGVRMATFDAIRTISLAVLTAICVRIGMEESRCVARSKVTSVDQPLQFSEE